MAMLFSWEEQTAIAVEERYRETFYVDLCGRS